MKKLVAMMVAAMVALSFSMVVVAAEEKAAEKTEKTVKKDAKKAKKAKEAKEEAKPAKKGKAAVSGC